MRTIRWISVLTLILSAVPMAFSADDATTQPTSAPSIIDVADQAGLKSAVDKEESVVEGVVDSAAWSGSGKVLKLEFKGTSESKFVAVIFVQKREEFDSAFSGDVAKTVAGARIRIKGKLKLYREAPEMVLDRSSQVTIVEPAPSTQPAK